MYCESASPTPQNGSHLVGISEVQVVFLTDITDKYADGFMSHSPGLYGPHTVNSAGMVSAHTPFLYVTAIVSLWGGGAVSMQ